MIVILRVLERPYGALVPVAASLLNALTEIINFGSRGNRGSDLSAGCSIWAGKYLRFCRRKENCEK